jgi:two-component system, NarL family, sensor histidine kinase DesK
MHPLRRLVSWPWVPAHHGKGPYVWLLMLWFFVQPYLREAPGVFEAAMLAATALVFLPLYFGSYWVCGQRSVLCVLALGLIGLLWAPHNSGASIFFIYAAAMCAGIARAPLAYAMLAAELAILGVAAYVNQLSPSFWMSALVVGTPVGLASINYSGLGRARSALLRKQEEVQHMATIAERERISRDLHDLLGHTLSLITLKAELAGKLIGRDLEAGRREIKDIETTARHALSEVRAAVTGYRQVGLAHELNSARACLAAANVELVTQVQTLVLAPATENVLALAVREAVTNVVRHAGATRCDIALSLEAGLIVLRLHDNGIGIRGLAELREGNGLIGMKERVHALGGKLALNTEQGMALELRIPMGDSA